MKFQVTQPQLTADLVAALRDGGCDCQATADGVVVALHRSAADDREARIELTFFVRAWARQHPGVAVEVLG